MNLDLKSQIRTLRYDVPSAVVVFLVAIPLCLGIALACKVPPLSGFIAGVVGGIIVTGFSKSSLSVTGPAAGLIAIVLEYQHSLGGFEIFLLALAIAGIFQILLGLLRLGSIAYFFPSPVIVGMLAAIGITLILKQLPHAVGYDQDYEGEMQFLQPDGKNTFSELFEAMTHVSLGATLIAVVCLGVLIIWENSKFLKSIVFLPGALVAVLVGTGINEIMLAMQADWALGEMHLVALPDFSAIAAERVAQGQEATMFSVMQEQIMTPDWSALGNYKVWLAGLGLMVVASLESLLSVEAIDKLDPFKRRTPLNRELVAQGVGNLTCGLVGGLPVTAVIVRSSVNLNAGGRTRKAAFIHGLLLLVAILFMAPILTRIPLAALAAILLMTGFKLAKPALFKKMWREGWKRFIPFIATIVAVILTDLLIGILIGIGIGIFFVLLENFQTAFSVQKRGDSYLLLFNKDVSFISKATLMQAMDRFPKGCKVVVNGEKADFIDPDMIEVMREFRQSAHNRNIEVKFEGFNRVYEMKILSNESSTGSGH